MIPKKIHYIWFGKKEKPDGVKHCIETWKKYLPDYEITEWNEDNFDINYNGFTKRAYECQKWAFVSDVARLWVLYNEGGIYMDTDVEVYQPLDQFLKYDFFTGFEQRHYPVTATMGAIKGSNIIKEMLEEYNNKTFELKQNWHEYETNTMIMSDVIGRYFDRDKVELQEKDNMAIYPVETFCSSSEVNDKVYTRHWMFGSWG